MSSPGAGEPSSNVGPNALDRRLTLPRLTWVSISTSLVLVAGAIIRLAGLDRWAVTSGEAQISLAANAIIRGSSIENDLAGAPFTALIAALGMFLGDTNETVARVIMALFGIVLFSSALWLGRLYGRTPALLIAVLLAASPTLIALSRTVDSGIMIATGVLLSILLTSRLTLGSSVSHMVFLGISLGATFVAGPLGPVATALTLIYLVMILPGTAFRLSRLSGLMVLAGFVGTIILSTTAFLTRPTLIAGSLGELFSQFWNNHLSDFGANAHLPLWNLLLNEPLIVVLAVCAVIWNREHPWTLPTVSWGILTLIAMSVIGDAGMAGYGLTILPFAILGGIGVVGLLTRLREGGYPALYPAAGFVLSLLVLGLALLSISMTSTGNDDSALVNIVRFVLILVIGVVPAGLLLANLGQRLGGYRIVLGIFALLCVLGVLTVRTSVLTASSRPGNPGEILYGQAMGESLPAVVDSLHKISRDLTREERDARMPVGGVALRISVDEQFAAPFEWYFRDYPNLTVFDSSQEAIPDGTQVAIVAEGYELDDSEARYSGQPYVYRYERPATYVDPDWSALLGGIFSFQEWRNLLSFQVNRDPAVPPSPEMFQLYAIPEIAERMFVQSGPYNLYEQAGTGQNGGQFQQPRGIAIDDSGTIYVVDAGNTRIQRFSADGSFEGDFANSGDGQLAPFPNGPGGAGGITIGSDGNLYVADTWNHRVAVYSPEGEFLRSWGEFFDAADDPGLSDQESGSFYGPRGIAAHDGRIYVTDTGNERVQIFTEAGEFEQMIGLPGGEGEQLVEPVGIAVQDDGVVLVADSHNARIARISANGEWLEPWPLTAWEGQQFFEPYIALADDGRLYASSPPTGEIIILDATGQHVGTLTSPDLQQPYGITLPDGSSQVMATDGTLNIVATIQAVTN